MQITQATSSTITNLWSQVESNLQQAQTLEAAAQQLAAALHTTFEESVLLARVYTTVPFETLPPANQSFVRALAGEAADLKDTTPVLSLIGTHGQEADWNSRHKSQGHVGIPLISSAFVSAIPMIARLLHELGVPGDWVDSHDTNMILETIGHTAGLFFVDNATEATDTQGRKIIAAQDFVSAYGVRSVFGIGGAYPDTGQILVIIVFCRLSVSRDTAEHFLPLVSLFQNKTAALVGAQQIFAVG